MIKVSGISEPLLISFFITGLQKDIRRELQFHRPATLMAAFARARAYEARFADGAPQVRPSFHEVSSFRSGPSMGPTPSQGFSSPSTVDRPTLAKTNQPMTGFHPHSSSTPHSPMPKLPPLRTNPALPIRRLTLVELRDKRERGLCYNCDEKFGPNHHCRSKYLLLLGCEEDNTTVDEQEEDSDSPGEEVSGDISTLHTLSCQHQGCSLCFFGLYGSKQFQVLIDSGSTHKFIKPALVQQLGLPVTIIPRFRVSTGSGAFLVCQYTYPATSLTLQGIDFTVDLFVLAIEGPDIVLGFPWLQLLGRVSHDYSALTMEFLWQGRQVTIKGESTKLPTPVSLHQLQALVQGGENPQLF